MAVSDSIADWLIRVSVKAANSQINDKRFSLVE